MTREEAIEWLETITIYYDMSDIERQVIDMAILALNEPEIIRCEFCEHHGMANCPMWEGAITEDFMWCSEAERKRR